MSSGDTLVTCCRYGYLEMILLCAALFLQEFNSLKFMNCIFCLLFTF